MGVAVLVLAVLLLAGMLFGVAAVSVGHGSAMSDAAPDRRDPLLPGRRIAPEDVEGLRFTMAVRGYRMDEVDAVLDRLSTELSVRDAELSRLRGGAPNGAGGPEARGELPVPMSAPSENSEGELAGAAPGFDRPEGSPAPTHAPPWRTPLDEGAPLDSGAYGGAPSADSRHSGEDPLGS
jgi:DivIVA domain-containing protein